MNIVKFDRENLRNIRTDLEDALEKVALKYGLSISAGGISFGETNFTCKITAITKEATGGEEVENVKWATAYKRYAAMWDIKIPINAEVTFNGRTGVLIGARPKARYPLVVKSADGKLHAVSVQDVKVK